MRGQAEGQRGAPTRSEKVKTKGASAEPPMRPKMQPSWVSEKIQLSFKKNPVRLQIPPHNDSHGPPDAPKEEQSGKQPTGKQAYDH